MCLQTFVKPYYIEAKNEEKDKQRQICLHLTRSKINLSIWARARQNLPIFWNWTHKNIPDRQHSARFRKSQEVLYYYYVHCAVL